MKLSDGEKLIVTMLCDLYQKLKIEGDLDPELLLAAIRSGNMWMLDAEYSNGFGKDVPGEEVRETADILDMWQFIEGAAARLSPADRAKLLEEAAPFGADPTFGGFDSHEEGRHLTYRVRLC